MLAPITSRRVTRKFTAYDFEWNPYTLEIRLCGAYDERGYRSYRTVREFLVREMRPCNANRWYFGHNAGKSDIEFILHELMDTNIREFSVDASFSGSSAVITRLMMSRRKYYLIDSLWLLRSSLREIGKSLGLLKGNEDESEEFYASAPIGLLEEYNAQDCRILYTALEELQRCLLDIGGQLQMTLASSAMYLFRRRFLKQSIATSEAVNEIARQTYFSSRVEVLGQTCEQAHYYDVNSSFPYSMTFPLMGALAGAYRRVPEDHDRYLVKADVSQRDEYIPIMPYRAGNRVFFPAGERKRVWISGTDFNLGAESGHLDVQAVHEVLTFNPLTELADFVAVVYDLKANAKSPYERLVWKLLGNSLYGKFSESTTKDGLLWNPPRPPVSRETDPTSEYTSVRMLFPGAFIVGREVEIAHRHIPLATHITSIARRTLWQWLDRASRGGRVYYCDTDSIVTTTELPTSSELGALKLEYEIINGTFLCPKVYRMAIPGIAAHDEPIEKVKAKGFSPGKKKAIDFAALAEGREVTLHRMLSVKETLRKGSSAPRIEAITKRIQGTLQPKRCYLPNGDTRPWHISEIL